MARGDVDRWDRRHPGARVRRGLVTLAALLLLWLAVGVRTLDPATEFGVLDGPLPGLPARIEGRWAIAAPGLLHLTRYPRNALQLPLPQAEQLRLPSRDGSHYGFRGEATIRARPDDWRALHATAGRSGLAGAVAAALRQTATRLALRPDTHTEPPPGFAQEMERTLSAVLGSAGIDLVALDLDSIDFLMAAPGIRPNLTDTKLLVVGLDGADWDVIDPLLAAGRMPTLARLVERGARGRLLSISPLLSPVIWTTVATGVEPARHGILDFLVADPAGGGTQPVTSVQRKVPTMWEMLSEARLPVGIVGWWATWPADRVRGYLISDRIAYQLFGFRSDLDRAEGKTWPPELYAEVRRLIVSPESIPWSRVQRYLSGPRRARSEFTPGEVELLDEFRTVLASQQTHLGIARRLRPRFRPRLELVYLESTDTAAHLFMPYRDPLLAGVDPRRHESFREVVDRVYEDADRALASLLEGLDDTWTVLVLSDHGFASDQTRPRRSDSRIGHGPAADWHRRFGIVVLSGRHVRAGVQLQEAVVFDIAPTVLALFGHPVPRSWPGRVLADALDPAFLRRTPVRFLQEEPARGELHAAAGADPGAEELRRKLQNLGYVSTGGPGEGGGNAQNNLGVTLLAQGKFPEAARAFREALQASPGQPTLLVNLGIALRMGGSPAEARRVLEQAAAHDVTRVAAGHQLAQLHMDAGDLASAERLLRDLLRVEPEGAQLRNSLGLVLEKRGDTAGAAREYRTAAELDPAAAEPRNNLGNLARARGDLVEARRWYERAIDADPYFMGAYNNLAMVFQDRGDTAAAMDLYRRALEKAPTHAVVLSNLASLYYASGDLEQARVLWSRARDADPGFASPLNNLAGLEIGAGRLDAAQDLLERALSLDPRYGDARINLAIVHARRGRVEDARRELRRAADDPRAALQAWIQLGRLDLETGSADDAVRAFENASALAPGDAVARAGLAEARRASGQVRMNRSR